MCKIIKYTNEDGFSLIELIIVMSIVCILLGTIGICMNAIERHSLLQTSVELKNNLRYVQAAALDQKRHQEILFDEHENLYWLRVSDENNRLKVFKTIKLNKHIKINTNAKNNLIAYTRNGTLESPACTLMISSKNYYLEMTVLVGTGRVRIIKDIAKKLS